MPPELREIDSFRRAIETLWFGLAEETRRRFSQIEVDPGRSDGEDLLGLRADDRDERPKLVVFFGSVFERGRKDPSFPWRRQLSHLMRRQSEMCAQWQSCRERPERPDPPAECVEDVGRLSFQEFSASIDRWTISPSAPPPDPAAPVSHPAPTSSSPESRTSVASVPPQPPSPPGRLRRRPLALLIAPLHAAFRRREAHGASLALLWLWRLAVAGVYLTIISGLVFLAVTMAVSLLTPVADGGEERTAARLDSEELFEEVTVDGRTLLIRRSWSAEAGPEDSLVISGPDGASITIEGLSEEVDAPGDLARACAGGRPAFALIGGGGMTYVDLRYEAAGMVWQARCVVQGRSLVRAAAPRLVFPRERLGDLLLVTLLAQQWSQAAGVGEADG